VGKGYYINWQMPNASIKTNPLYLKYSNAAIQDLDIGVVQGQLAAIKPDAENAEMISYLSWLIRCIRLLQ